MNALPDAKRKHIRKNTDSLCWCSDQGMEVIVPDPSKVFQSSGMVESKSVGTFSPLQRHDSQRGNFVDRGVGSPRLVRSSSSNIFSGDNLGTGTKVCTDTFHLLFNF